MATKKDTSPASAGTNSPPFDSSTTLSVDDASSPPFDLSTTLRVHDTSPAPQPSRAATQEGLRALLQNSARPRPCNVYGPGSLLLSDVPNDVWNNVGGVVLGIDEAGRGPTLGPMTYAAAFWHPSSADSIPVDFDDSKQLTAEKRGALFEEIRTSASIGFALRILHASEISRNMLRRLPYNLNNMSHDAAIELIQAVLDAGVKIDTCYIDTVGNADSYKKKLIRVFEGNGITFIVEKKADANYAPCSAASVVAKESRELIIANWKWTETPHYEPRRSNDFGSGYPSDPKCKAWLDDNTNLDAPFGFPDFVRFSWGPARSALNNDGEHEGPDVRWEAEEEDENGGRQFSLDEFVVARTSGSRDQDRGNMEALRGKRPRLGIFSELGLAKAVTFFEAMY